MITVQWATGYVTPVWDTRQHVLIDITSCLTLLGQSLSKTAFAVTLLKLTKGERWQQWVLWFIIITMNLYNLIKVRKYAPQSLSLQYMLTILRSCSNGAGLAALRRTTSWFEWTSASMMIFLTTSRRAETVGFYLGWHVFLHRLTFCSLQHHHGFRPRRLSMDDNMELEYQNIRKNWTLCGHVSGIVMVVPHPFRVESND